MKLQFSCQLISAQHNVIVPFKDIFIDEQQPSRMKGEATGNNFIRWPAKAHPKQMWFNLVNWFKEVSFVDVYVYLYKA